MSADPIAGNGWLVQGLFTQQGVPADPETGPTFTLTAPDGIVTTPTPTHNATGDYSLVVFCDLAGRWECLISAPFFGVDALTWTVADA